MERVQYGGMCDIDQARALAKRIFELYDLDKNALLTAQEVAPMMRDTYRVGNRDFVPARSQVEAYARILDSNGDGCITLQDVEDLCIKYLAQNDFQKKEVVKKQVRSAKLEQRLDVSRRLFKQFDTDKDGWLYLEDIGPLLIETYRSMGVNNFEPTMDDVKSFMAMVDTDGDGKIGYNISIIKTIEVILDSKRQFKQYNQQKIINIKRNILTNINFFVILMQFKIFMINL